MTLGQKLKTIRKRFGLSQEQLAEMLEISRQSLTKWENDSAIPDTKHLQKLADIFSITIDYFLNRDRELPVLSMRKFLDQNKYKNKITSYPLILKEYYPAPCEIYNLARFRKMTKLEWILDLFTWGVHNDLDTVSDLSPYYLVKKDDLKLLVNIKNWVMEVIELPASTNEKKFIYGTNKFVNCGRIRNASKKI